jgi:hypothetical protein
LFVQNYASNLLSINKIIHELNYEVFSSKNIFFQEWITKRIIGKDFIENELYFLNEEKCNFNANKEELGTFDINELVILPIKF